MAIVATQGGVAAGRAIRRLPPLLVNQIAAGESIERPASVVKELVENSLDAGAGRIEVAVEDGGRQLIRVRDDGCGIPEDQIALALAAHATSKIATAEDLEAIHTLGFRGEALASIASVSRLRLTTRCRDAEAASVVEATGDELGPPAPAAAGFGTTIEVRDLFFNTPARRKFMRTAPTEFGHIADTLARLALMHPGVGFTLTHNGRSSLDLPPVDSRHDRGVAVLGEEIAEGLLEFEESGSGARGPGSERTLTGPGTRHPEPGRVWGLAGLPNLARGSAKFQYLCVNGRAVRDRQLAHAVKEAYRGLIPHDRHPLVVVMLRLDPAEVDVNVHPTKAEVRFRQPSRVHGLVLTAIRQRLLGADLTPKADFRSPSPDFRLPEPDAAGDAADVPSTDSRQSAIAHPDQFVDYFRRMDPKQKGFVFEQVKQQVEQDKAIDAAYGTDPAGGGEVESINHQPSPINHRPVLSFRNSYVVTEDDEGLLIVDQHALHERVMFEQLRRRVLGSGDDGRPRTLESQRLLMPATVDADGKQQATLVALAPLLERVGIDASPIGPAAVAVHAFPSFLFERGVEPEAFLRELLDKADAGEIDPDAVAGKGRADADAALEAALHEVLDMMACKAAVKAGDKLSDDELAALLAQRDAVERSSNCPHGRPTTLRLTLKDLERQFGRV